MISFFIIALYCDLFSTVISQSCSTHTQSLIEDSRAHATVYSSLTDHVYIFGGMGSSNIYKWDLASSFVSIGSIPSDITAFSSWSNNAIVVDDIIYFIGMRTDTDSATFIPLKYDVISEQWLDNTNLAPPPVPLIYGCLSTNGTHAFMIDGQKYDEDRTDKGILQIYNIADNSWSTTSTPVAYGWRSQFCSLLDDMLYVFGGKTASWGESAAMYKYSLKDDEWYTFSSVLPTVDDTNGGKAVYWNNVIYLVGDRSNGEIEAFNVYTETLYTAVLTLSTPVYDASVVIVDNTIYILGGSVANNKITDIQMCELVSQDFNDAIYTSKAPEYVYSTETTATQSSALSQTQSSSLSQTQSTSLSQTQSSSLSHTQSTSIRLKTTNKAQSTHFTSTSMTLSIVSQSGFEATTVTAKNSEVTQVSDHGTTMQFISETSADGNAYVSSETREPIDTFKPFESNIVYTLIAIAIAIPVFCIFVISLGFICYTSISKKRMVKEIVNMVEPNTEPGAVNVIVIGNSEDNRNGSMPVVASHDHRNAVSVVDTNVARHRNTVSVSDSENLYRNSMKQTTNGGTAFGGTAFGGTDKRKDIMRQWMRNAVQLEQYTDLLLQNGYDSINCLEFVNMEDLRVIGIDKIAHRRKIFECAKKWAKKGEPNTLGEGHYN